MHEGVLDSALVGRRNWPERARLLKELRPGDIVIVQDLKQLSLSLRDLLRVLESIAAAGAMLRSIAEDIDTSGPAGEVLARAFVSLAKFERDLHRERVMVGRKEARRFVSQATTRR